MLIIILKWMMLAYSPCEYRASPHTNQISRWMNDLDVHVKDNYSKKHDAYEWYVFGRRTRTWHTIANHHCSSKTNVKNYSRLWMRKMRSNHRSLCDVTGGDDCNGFNGRMTARTVCMLEKTLTKDWNGCGVTTIMASNQLNSNEKLSCFLR